MMSLKYTTMLPVIDPMLTQRALRLKHACSSNTLTHTVSHTAYYRRARYNLTRGTLLAQPPSTRMEEALCIPVKRGNPGRHEPVLPWRDEANCAPSYGAQPAPRTPLQAEPAAVLTQSFHSSEDSTEMHQIAFSF